MPSSNEIGKAEIKEWFINIFHERMRVVDFGCGAGTYPKLLGKEGIEWIGIEIWEPYMDQFKLREWYNELIIGDLCEIVWPIADCAIFGDVLEHLNKQEAIKAMRQMDEIYKHVAISIPIYNSQGATDNPYEEHKHWWLWDELEEAVPQSFQIRLRLGDPSLVPSIPLMGVFLK